MSVVAAPDFSVIVPAFNEEAAIGECMARLRSYLDRTGLTWELLVVDDGSRDRTAELVRRESAGDPRIRLIAGGRRGKGGAVKLGMLEARGVWRFMADADLSTPPENIGRFFEELRRGPAIPHVAVGSREAPGARRFGEPASRHFIGRCFNALVQLLVLRGINDTQCGFKLFSAEAADTLFPWLSIEGFAFDVELLFLARRAGMGIREVPVDWHCRVDSRVQLSRGVGAFADVLRIRWNALRGRYRGLRRQSEPPPAWVLRDVSL